ncbi:MAG: alpha/beta fold hydrolase [Hyphomicrobiales bacterium]|nr:alpha/beta fold hydrolase [Hyphomicrobiales bacterium]
MPYSATGLYYEHGGQGPEATGPLAVLLHGLSGTGAIWRGLTDILDREWPGRWIAPDFRGHGRSPHAERYGMGLHAADIAGSIGAAREVYLIGQSMGGQCAMMLAGGAFGFKPKASITIGVAVDWGNEARERIDRLVHTPARYFDTELQARERFVLVNGLKGLIEPDSDIAASGICESGGKWRLSADNRAAMVADLSTRQVYAAATSPIVLARGEHDPVVTHAEHLSLDGDCILMLGCGHNAHVERPEEIWKLLRDAAGL